MDLKLSEIESTGAEDRARLRAARAILPEAAAIDREERFPEGPS